MALITGNNSLFASALAAIGASVCCVGPLILLTLGVGGAWVANLTALGPYRPFFIGLTMLFLGFAFYKLYLLPQTCILGSCCLSYPLTATVHSLAGCSTPALSIGRALVRPTVLLREDHHASATDYPAGQVTFHSAGRPANIRYARGTEYDLRGLPHHCEEDTKEGAGRKCSHGRFRQENSYGDLRPGSNHIRSGHQDDHERRLPLHRTGVMSHEYPCS